MIKQQTHRRRIVVSAVLNLASNRRAQAVVATEEPCNITGASTFRTFAHALELKAGEHQPRHIGDVRKFESAALPRQEGDGFRRLGRLRRELTQRYLLGASR